MFMRRLISICTVSLSLCLLCVPAQAEDEESFLSEWVEFSGSLQSTYRQSVHEKNPLAANQRLSLQMEINSDSWIRGFMSGYVDADLAVFGREKTDEDVVQSELTEAYVTIDTRNIDVILGMQHIRWGEADSMSSFDIINSVDLRNPIATARSSQRLAVAAVDVRTNISGGGLLDLVFIPAPRFSSLPESGSPWEDSSLKTLRTFEDLGLAHLEDENCSYEPEFAARLKFFKAGYDWALLFYRGYEHTPLYTMDSNSYALPVTIKEQYEMYHALGLNTAFSLWDATFRGEFTVKVDYPFQSDLLTVEKRNDSNAILGWDKTFFTNFTVNLQAFLFSHDGKEVVGIDRNRYGASWSVSDIYMDEALKVGLRGNYYMNNGDYSIEAFSEYEYDDNIRLFCGYMMFGGDKDSDIGQYYTNDHAYLSIKYTF